MQFHYWSQSCIFYRAWICNQSITSKYCNAIVHRFFPKKMWFLTLQITINATSLEQLCEHEYVLSCQVERTPRWPPAASSVPRAVERTCPEAPTSAHTHQRHLLPCCTHNHHHHRFLYFWSSGLAQNCLQTLLYYQWNATTQGHLSTTTIHYHHHHHTHLCCFCTCERIPSTFPQRSDAVRSNRSGTWLHRKNR